MNDAPSNGPDSDYEAGNAAPGEWLREKRESLGWPLEQVGQELRILPSVLRALEENRFEVLEAPIFVRGHLRNYSRLLGLSPEEVLEAYESSQPTETDPSLKVSGANGPAMHSRTPAWVIPFGGLVVLTMLVLGGLYWYVDPAGDSLVADSAETDRSAVDSLAEEAGSDGQESPSARPLDEPVDRTQDEQPLGDDLDVSTTLDALPEHGVAGETEGEGAQSSESREEGEASNAVSSESAADPEEADRDGSSDASSTAEEEPTEAADSDESVETADAGPVPDAGTPGVRSLTLRLSDDSWLEVYDDQDRQLYYGLAAAGEAIRLRGEAPISLFMGNAPAVELEVDGQAYDFSARIRRDSTARITVQAGEDGADGEPSDG